MADVFEVLKQDHDDVRRMLAELHIGPTALTGATESQLAARKRLADQLILAEARHEAVEEESSAGGPQTAAGRGPAR